MDDMLFSYADPASPAIKRNFIRFVEAATGQRRLKSLYLDRRYAAPIPESFWQATIRKLALDVRFDRAALQAIPKQGPVVVVANHPYGVLDGLVVAWLLDQARSDFLILTHAVLLRAPEVRSSLLPIDFAETPEALETNLKSRATARRHLEAGGCIAVFPAGGVSTAPDRLGRARAVDAAWAPFTAQLIQRSQATVVPVFFAGQNSRLFQIASHFSQTLRVSLIFHEVKKRIGTALPVVIGAPIPFEDLAALGSRPAMMNHLRAVTYKLAGQLSPLPSEKTRVGERMNAAVRSRFMRLRDRGLARRTRRGMASPTSTTDPDLH